VAGTASRYILRLCNGWHHVLQHFKTPEPSGNCCTMLAKFGVRRVTCLLVLMPLNGPLLAQTQRVPHADAPAAGAVLRAPRGGGRCGPPAGAARRLLHAHPGTTHSAQGLTRSHAPVCISMRGGCCCCQSLVCRQACWRLQLRSSGAAQFAVIFAVVAVPSGDRSAKLRRTSCFSLCSSDPASTASLIRSAVSCAVLKNICELRILPRRLLCP